MRSYFINGTEILIKNSWSITDKINARSTLQLAVVDLGDLTSIENGDQFQMLVDAVVIFAGLVKKVTVTEPEAGRFVYSIKVADYASLAEKRLIAAVYENTLVGDIAKDLITQKLGSEGVTIGTIEDGPIISKAVFNYIKISSALDQLKELTGFIWNIDVDKKLNFTSRETTLAPFSLDDSVPVRGFVHEKNMDLYRNTNYVRGGLTETELQEDLIPTPKPDGKSRTFVWRYPLAQKPILRINGVAVNPNDIGINGIDTGKKWYFAYNSDTITQDSAEPVLIDTQVLDGDIVGLRQLFVAVDDPIEINARQAVEVGGSGIYEYLSIEKSIDTTAQGIAFGNAQLEIYAQIQDFVTFTTSVQGLKAGQLLKVQKTGYNINEDFLIESVILTPDGPGGVEYTVKALDGASIGGWEGFFKELLKRSSDFVIAENEVIILLQTQIETTRAAGSYNIQTFEPPVVSESLIVGTFNVGGEILSEVDLND